jgi:hypothetical protein
MHMICNLSLALRQFVKALGLGIVVFCQSASHAQEAVDIVEYFGRAQDARGAGLARKSKPVDVRHATPDEVIVTMIRGEGKETQSPPAKSGDMVVRNRCPETGNEQILAPAASFLRRYEGPIGATDVDGWAPYRPRGVQMRFVVVTERDGSFNFCRTMGRENGCPAGGLDSAGPQQLKGYLSGRQSSFRVHLRGSSATLNGSTPFWPVHFLPVPSISGGRIA